MATPIIVDYGVGNLGSVIHACRRAGCEPAVIGTKDELAKASPSHILFPGVGAIGEALHQLRSRELVGPLTELARVRKIPTLAICVGMQMLGETCSEFGEHVGLGWLAGGKSQKIAAPVDIRLPHMGWNEINVVGDHGGLLNGLDAEHFYFLHSYAISCDPSHLIATADYHCQVTAAVRTENVYGVQFHPEKSNSAGSRLVANFFAL